MRAVTFMAPGQVLVQEVPEPVLSHPRDAIVRIEASGVCGSDLHIYHGRVKIEPGFTLGHEYVGTVIAVGAFAIAFAWMTVNARIALSSITAAPLTFTTREGFTVALPTSAVPSLVATNAAATFIFSAEQNG